VDAFYNRGTAYRDKREYDRAIQDLNEAIRLDPNLALAYDNRGNAYSRKGASDGGGPVVAQARQLYPSKPTTRALHLSAL
jgi:tetratricopeptide (TPR) repeat protein